MKNNVARNGELRPCTSCQVCAAVCPVDAISIRLNKDGFYRPYVDDGKCVDCGRCVTSCYKYDPEIKRTSDFSGITLYAAQAISKNTVKETTSGGIADILAQELISQGFTCIGVVYDPNHNCAVGKIATTIGDTEGFRGSKYIQPLSVDAFRQLIKEKNHKYAVFGLPCQIYALDRALILMGVRQNHILIDLYCHGCPSLNLWTKYADSVLKKVKGDRIVSANFRSKVRGWGNYVLSVEAERRGQRIQVVSPRINDPFYTLFFSDLVLNDSCSSCEVRSTFDHTDIRLGDFWGHKFVKDHSGVSGVTVCSGRGRLLFERIRSRAIISEQDLDSFLHYQSFGRIYPVDEKKRRLLLDMLSDKQTGINKVADSYRQMLPFKAKIVLALKNVIKLLPNSVISSSKALIYGLKRKL